LLLEAVGFERVAQEERLVSSSEVIELVNPDVFGTALPIFDPVGQEIRDEPFVAVVAHDSTDLGWRFSKSRPLGNSTCTLKQPPASLSSIQPSGMVIDARNDAHSMPHEFFDSSLCRRGGQKTQQNQRAQTR
jgi:hypothetical protein